MTRRHRARALEDTSRAHLVIRLVLILVTAGGLAYDAYVHLDLASTYDAARTSALSQGDLFRAESVAAILAGALLLLRPRRYSALIAFAVAAAGLGAVLLYRYVNVGRLGPIPSMYEPVWYPEKTHSALAEAIAAVAAFALLAMLHVRARRGAPQSADPRAAVDDETDRPREHGL